MFTEEMPKIVGGYFKLFEEVQNHFKIRFEIERLSRQGELGLIFKTPAGAEILYFALRWDLWSRMNITLWVGMRPEWSPPAADAFRARNQGRSFMHEGYILSPFDQAAAAGGENPLSVIQSLERELAAAGAAE